MKELSGLCSVGLSMITSVSVSSSVSVFWNMTRPLVSCERAQWVVLRGLVFGGLGLGSRITLTNNSLSRTRFVGWV